MHALIGRQRERALLEGAVERLGRGRGDTVLLAGEPGIGKSRLLTELAMLAEGAGVPVVWGRVSEVGGAPALWPWMEVLAGLVATKGADAVTHAAGPGAPLVARLAPQIGGADAGGASQIESDNARFLLFDAVVSTLRGLAPLVVLLDDLHAADHASLLLLEHAARALAPARVLLVGSFRPEDADAAPEVARILYRVARGATHVPLGRLAPEETAALLTRELGRAPGGDELARVVEASEGSPLFVLEFGRLMRARGDRAGLLPAGVRHAIEARLERLPEATRVALARASVLGREVDMSMLAVVGVAVEALEQPLALGLLVERQPELLVFSHVLIREALHRRLPVAESAALHVAVADALAARGRPGTEIVHHLLQGGERVSDERLVAAVVTAARELVAVLAFDDAAAFVRRVMGQRTFGEGARGELTAELGSALIRAGRLEDGKQACIEAAAIARRLGDADLFTRAALSCGIQFTPGIVDERLVSLLAEADAMGVADVGRRARIKARLAAARQPARYPAEPIALALEAVALARTVDDAGVLRDVLAGATSALAYFGEPELRARLDEELHDRAMAAGDRVLALRALGRLVYDELDRGQRRRAEHHLARYEALAATLGRDRFMAPAWLMRAVFAFMSGDVEAARGLERRASEALGLEHAGITAHTTALQGLSQALALHDARRMSELDAGFVVMGQVAASFVDRECGWVAAAAIAARLGDRARAEERLRHLAPASWAETEELSTMAWLVDPLLLVGATERVAAIYTRLEAVGHRHHTGSGAMHMYDGPYALPLGLAAAGLGRLAEAERWLERAVAEARRVEAPMVVARAALALGELLMQAGRRAEARPLLDEALALGRRFGIADIVARAEAGLAEPAVAVREVAPTATPARPRTAEAASAKAALELRRDGGVWAVVWGDRLGHFRDSRGMAMLATLVARPDVEVPATLLDGQEGGADAGVEALDQAAVRDYRARAEELRDALAEAEELGDAHRVSRYRDELEALASELARGVGLGGRPRKQGSQAERARVNVQRRIKDALARIAEAMPELGRHLEASVRTGAFCVYAPRRDA